ncbi:MAG TPA: YqgE/AlgH family protein [Phycisphaerae bacterium]|nr:YqgE/AlgH family protein [Phycisphaerae bacterium]
MESPLVGKVLVASPQLLDPNFARSVVLVVQHDAKGAMGLVLNRPLETSVGEAWSQVSAVPYDNGDPLFQGGPVEGPLMVIHHDAARGQIEVLPRVYLSSDADAVRGLVADATEPMKFFVGYSGWTAMQLESELAEGAWHVALIEAEHVLETPPALWEQMVRHARKAVGPAVDPKLIPPDPSVN